MWEERKSKVSWIITKAGRPSAFVLRLEHCTHKSMQSLTTYIGIGVKITHGLHAFIVLLIHETFARLIKRGALRRNDDAG
jgi:hypothetical protein